MSTPCEICASVSCFALAASVKEPTHDTITLAFGLTYLTPSYSRRSLA